MNNAAPAFDPIAAALRQMHEAIASEALPADFTRLLDEIDAKIAAVKTAALPVSKPEPTA